MGFLDGELDEGQAKNSFVRDAREICINLKEVWQAGASRLRNEAAAAAAGRSFPA